MLLERGSCPGVHLWVEAAVLGLHGESERIKEPDHIHGTQTILRQRQEWETVAMG